MGDRLRLAFGVLGNAASVLLFASPILTFRRVIKKKSTEGFSFVPYIVALSNCLLGNWYAMPVVSYGWQNFSLVTVTGLGILLEVSFLLIYLRFAPSRAKVKVALSLIAVLIGFCSTVTISAFVFQDHHHRKEFVGSIGLVIAVAMYASPLSVVKQVIVTKSVEFMPFYLSFFSFLSSLLWLAYGLLGHDIFIAAPNLMGILLSTLQLVIYFKYRKGRTIEEQNKGDLEKDDEKSNQLQLAVNDSINGKVETIN